ncbi:MAG: AI-2E family transporter [Bacteroidales bacterium]
MVRKHFPMPLITRLTIVMLFWILLFVIFQQLRMFLYPLFLGILFAYLFYPMASTIERTGVPRILANILSIIVGITVLYGILIFIYRRLQEFMIDLPVLEEQAIHNIKELLAGIERRLGFRTDPEQSQLVRLTRELFNLSSEGLKGTITATFNTLFSVFIMPVYIFFFLYYRNKFKEFILKLIPDKEHPRAEAIIEEINMVTMKYMTGIFIVVLILCVLNSVGLKIVGLKYALLWGVIAAVANFIPYFGTVIGYSFPFLVALLTGDSPNLALGVIVLFIIVQFTENNILTPNIVGGLVRINPFFIILGVLFGGIIWGIPGMFIVVPFMGMAKIVFDRVPGLEHWGYLLGDQGTEKHALNIQNIRNFFRSAKKSQ